MKANEVVRFRCGDCQIVFDRCVDHMRETEATIGPPRHRFRRADVLPVLRRLRPHARA
jgi:hypothetical protein